MIVYVPLRKEQRAQGSWSSPTHVRARVSVSAGSSRPGGALEAEDFIRLLLEIAAAGPEAAQFARCASECSGLRLGPLWCRVRRPSACLPREAAHPADVAVRRELGRTALQLIEARCLAVSQRVSARRVVECSHLIIGGGLAAALDCATLPEEQAPRLPLWGEVPERFEVLAVRAEGEPWSRFGQHPAGQSAEEWSSEGFVMQPSAFTALQTEYAPAAALASAIAWTALANGMECVEDRISSVLARHASDRYGIRGGQFEYAAQRVDIAVGLGPPRRLSDDAPQVEAVEARLRADGRLLDGPDYLASSETRSTGSVLVLGGGPTGAWCAVLATQRGAQRVDWVSGPREPMGDPTSAAFPTAHARRCSHLLGLVRRRLTSGLPSAQGRALLRRLEIDLTCFWQARLFRNRNAFRSPGIQRRGDVLVGLEATDRGGILARFRDGREDEYDSIIACVGHSATAPTGPVGLALAGSIALKPHFVDLPDGAGNRMVALQGDGPNAGFRVLGAGIYCNFKQAIADTVALRRHQRAVRKQSGWPETPKASDGVPGSIYQAALDIPLANGLRSGEVLTATLSRLYQRSSGSGGSR